MARKVFISVLGTGPYSECTYSADGHDIMTTRYIQLATLKYLFEKEEKNDNKWTSTDAALIFVTKKSKDDQWDKGKARTSNGETVFTSGLKEESEKMRFPMTWVPKPIDDGKDEKEIWEIFNVIYDEIKEGDELYFDITHAFRYLPMLLLVLINYVKFLKNVTVKSITYGNFMAEGTNKPIMNLTSISQLQDWTYAAGTYLDSGNVDKLVEMSGTNYTDFAEKLKETIADFHTCRGISIIESSNIKQVKTLMNSMDTSNLPPLKFVFDKIKADFSKYDDVLNVKNGSESAKWCYKNQLYQQAITILIETVISDICIFENLDWKRRKNRDVASSALYIVANNVPEKGWSIIQTENKDKYKPECLTMLETNPCALEEIEESVKYKSKYYSELMLYRQLVKSQRVQELVELSTMIKDVRDDIDHAGMRDGARSFSEIETKLKEIFTTLNTIVPCS